MNGEASSLTLNSAVFAPVGRLYELLLSSHRAKQQQCEVCALFHVAEREKQWRNYSACTKGARKKINKGSDNYRMCYDNFPKRDERSHYSDTRQKRARAVFRQTGNNLGAVLETTVTGWVQVRRRACKEKEVGRAELRGGGESSACGDGVSQETNTQRAQADHVRAP